MCSVCILQYHKFICYPRKEHPSQSARTYLRTITNNFPVNINYSSQLMRAGWISYFVLLEGVVTELGGILSHGSVVAREYGLPTIVGAVGATDFFQSGETVILDADTGFVARYDPAFQEVRGSPVDSNAVNESASEERRQSAGGDAAQVATIRYTDDGALITLHL